MREDMHAWLRTERLEPTVMLARTLAKLPTRSEQAILAEEPTRANMRTETDDPRSR
jgi:hypothetical protein